MAMSIKNKKKGFLSALFLQHLFSHLQKLGLARQASRENDIMTDQVAECCSEDRRRLSLLLLQACCTYYLHMHPGARPRKTYVCKVASMQTLTRTHASHFLYRHRHNSVWSLAERAAPSPQTVTLYRYSTGTMTSSYSVCSPLPPPPPSPRCFIFAHVEISVKGQRFATALTQQSALNAFPCRRAHTELCTGSSAQKKQNTRHGCRHTQNTYRCTHACE